MKIVAADGISRHLLQHYTFTFYTIPNNCTHLSKQIQRTQNRCGDGKTKGTNKDWALSSLYWHWLTLFFMNCHKMATLQSKCSLASKPSCISECSPFDSKSFLEVMTFSVNYNMWLTSSDDGGITGTTQPQNTESWIHQNLTWLFSLYPEGLWCIRLYMGVCVWENVCVSIYSVL